MRPFAKNFLDSGAFALRGRPEADYRPYMDGYADFLGKHSAGVDLYANVDVMGDASRSWDNLKYLEEHHGLSPVPVVHYGAPLSCLDRHLEAGYATVALGGIAATAGAARCESWLDSVFGHLCRGGPVPVKVHGFGIGGLRWIMRYPWHSVDTVRWALLGSRGYVPYPKRRLGVPVLDCEPVTVRVGNSPENSDGHVRSLSAAERTAVYLWLEELGVRRDELDRPASWYKAYLLFYEHVAARTRPWPWCFTAPSRPRFTTTETARAIVKGAGVAGRFRVYYSGQGMKGARPEDVLGADAHLMLAYAPKPPGYVRRLLEACG